MDRLAILAAAAGVGLAGLAIASPIVMDEDDPGANVQGDFYFANYNQTAEVKALNEDMRWTNSSATEPNAYQSWQFSSLAPGAYEVYVTWPADRTLAPYWARTGNTASPYTVIDGAVQSRGWPDWDIIPVSEATVLETVYVDQSVNAAGYSYGGLSWYKLGTYNIASDTLSLILTNHSADTNGQVLADGALIVSAIPEPTALGLIAGAALLSMRRRQH